MSPLGSDQEEAGHPLGVAARVLDGGRRAQAVAGEEEAAQAELVGHGRHVGREAGDGVVAVLRRIGLAMAAEVEGHGAPVPAQVVELQRPLAAVAAQAVKEEDGELPGMPIAAIAGCKDCRRDRRAIGFALDVRRLLAGLPVAARGPSSVKPRRRPAAPVTDAAASPSESRLSSAHRRPRERRGRG